MRRLLLVLLVLLAPAGAHGHGNASETLGPVEINGRPVLLEISSSESDPELAGDQQISISLIDESSSVTLRDVTFAIRAERGDEFLFEREFEAEHGFVVFNFASGPGPVQITEEEGSDFFASLLGFESRLVHVTGPGLAAGGLYKFQVGVARAEGGQLDPPPEFAAGVSVPQTVRHHIDDPNYGSQYVDIISYYDTVHGISYDPGSRELAYVMPFEWSEDNINQTLVVHQEIAIPDGYGDLLASGFEMGINGEPVDPAAVNIDDFAPGHRLVHFTIFQQELLRIMEEAGSGGMEFVIRPDRDYIHQSAVTHNGQFRVFVHAPGGLHPGQEGTIQFEVTDVFLRGAPVEAEYKARIYQGDVTIHEQSGTSSGERDMPDEARFAVPADVTGVVYADLTLDGNERASATIPLVVDRAEPLPHMLREAARAWAQGSSAASDFADALAESGTYDGTPPSWLRTAAGAWAAGVISDRAFGDITGYLAAAS